MNRIWRWFFGEVKVVGGVVVKVDLREVVVDMDDEEVIIRCRRGCCRGVFERLLRWLLESLSFR